MLAVAGVVRDVAWRKIFKLAVFPRGRRSRHRDQGRDKLVLEAEGVDSMLKLASSFRIAINAREKMLQIQLTALMGRGLEEAEIEKSYKS